MTNMEIIAAEAIASGFYTIEDVELFAANNVVIPFHTFTVWKSMGYAPKKGTKGWETKLWRLKSKKQIDEEAENGTDNDKDKESYYLAKAYLFDLTQVEKIDSDK